ncbi:uncharacterized mitochondrial protein AtMg00810-like [Quercus suber]|uniref:uncharacterized mitochondrial protein AtMg00810-like n=1 Tax=Quercus suber TaxID=58331 RepID=UPI0032DE4688
MASHYDFALFLCCPDKGTILLLLYVDDMIITGDDFSDIQELKDFLNQQFEMKNLGYLSYFLGLEITHSIDRFYITQANKIVDTPVEVNAHLTPSGGKPLSNHSLYRRLGTLFHSLFYSAQSPLVLSAFSVADWAGDPIDCKSTTGYCFLLSSSLISWRSKKQTHVAHSNIEAEYRAFVDTTSELLWL